MSEKIKVIIKVRPLIGREKSEGAVEHWTVVNNAIFPVDSKNKEKESFYFDHVFDQTKTNADMFEAVTRPIVDAAVRGFNGTIFAYGQTSSGKTYTMTGTEFEPGIIPQTINYIFQAIHSITCLEDRKFLLRASYMEIYNERITDLLEGKEGLRLREVDGQVVIAQLKEEVACTADKILELMKRGEKKRKTSRTNMNEHSSRSHTIFRIIIESVLHNEEENGAIQVSHLNLVDLAGSERVDQTGAMGERLKEGCSINRSLFMLGHVISQLSEGQDQHIHFRNSKLTRILQSSLGGNAHTAIICTVTPAVIEETISTLGFASRATNINNKPLKNEVLTDAALLKRYARQIAKLRDELEKTKHSKSNEEIESKLEETRMHNRLLQQRIDLLQEKLIDATLIDSNLLNKKKTVRRMTWGGCTTKSRFSICHPQTLNPIEEDFESESQEQEIIGIFSRSIEDFGYNEFETPLEEFELDLIEAERNRFSSDSCTGSEDSHALMYKRSKNVSFANQVNCRDFECQTEAFKLDSFHNINRDAGRLTEKSEPCSVDEASVVQCKKCEIMASAHQNDTKEVHCQTVSPFAVAIPENFTIETPPKELRERAKYFQKEYDELREFTTLEKQMICEEELSALLHENEQLRKENQEIKKTVMEIEMMYLESNRALSFMRDENVQLTQKLEKEAKECSELSNSISILNKTQENTNAKLKDISHLEKEMKTLKQKLQILENEKLDFEIIKQLQEEKYHTRIAELTKSLEEAWKQNENIIQSAIDPFSCEECSSLKKELEILGAKISRDKVNDIALENSKDILQRKLSDAENKILELTSIADFHSNCTSLLKEKEIVVLSLQKQLGNKEMCAQEMKVEHSKLTDCLKANEQTLILVQEELTNAQNEIMELIKIRDSHVTCTEVLREKEENVQQQAMLQKELEKKYSELTDILKGKEEEILVLQGRLIEAENNLEEIRKLRESYATCAEELKKKEEQIHALQNQLTYNEKIIKEMEEKFSALTDKLTEREQNIAILGENLAKAESEMQNIHTSYAGILSEKEDLIISLQQQLTESNKGIIESEEKCSKLAENLKENEETAVLLQRDLIAAQNQVNELTKINQLHTECERVLKDNQQTITLLQEQLTNNERSMSEAFDTLKESQESVTSLQQKLNNAENEITAMAELKTKLAILIRQKEEAQLSLEAQLSIHQISLAEMEQSCSKLAHSLKEKEETVAKLEGKLHEIEKDLRESKYLKEIHSKCVDIMKVKDEALLKLEKKLYGTESCTSETRETSETHTCTKVLKNEIESLLSLQDTVNEISLIDMLQICPNIAQALKEKEDIIKQLQENLCEAKNYAKDAKEIINIHSLCAETLKEKEQSFLLIQEKLAIQEKSLVELTYHHSKLTQTLREKEESIVQLKEKLQEFEMEIKGTELKETHLACLEILKQKDELLSFLQEKLTANEISAAKMAQDCSSLADTLKEMEEHVTAVEKQVCEAESSKEEMAKIKETLSECMEALKEKDKSLSSKQADLATQEISLIETNQNYSILKQILKEKEENIGQLQEKLQELETEIKEKTKIEETHIACLGILKQKDELLSFLQEKLTANEISAAKMAQYCSSLADALKEMEEHVTAIEKKVCEAESSKEEMAKMKDTLSVCMEALKEKDKSLSSKQADLATQEISLIETNQNYSILKQILKEKEENIWQLQEKLQELETEIKEKAKIEETHKAFLEILKQKDELLSFLQEKLTANEISAAKMAQYCSSLADALKEIEENVTALEKKVCETESSKEEMTKMKETLSVYMETLKEKDKSFSLLQANLVTNETALTEMTEKCSELTHTLQQNEEIVVLLQKKQHLYERDIKEAAELREIYSACVEIVKKKDTFSLLQEEVTKEKSAAEMKQNCLKLAEALKEQERETTVLQEKAYETENSFKEAKNVEEFYSISEALKGKEETVSTFQHEMYETQSYIREMKKIDSTYVELPKERKMEETLLKGLLSKFKLEIIETRKTEENNKECAELLRQKEEMILSLKEQLANSESLIADLEEKYFKLADTFNDKEVQIDMFQEKINNMANEMVAFTELKALHVMCTKTLLEKEDVISSLQEQLMNNKKASEKMVENSKLDELLKEKEDTLKLLQENINEAEKEMLEAAKLKEINEMNVQALEQKTVDMLCMKKQLSNNEIFIKELKKDHAKMVNVLKNKEESHVFLQEKLHKAEEEIVEAAKVKEIHLTCAKVEKEREEDLLLLKKQIATFELHANEMEERYKLLANNLDEKEKMLASLQEKLRALEDYMLRIKIDFNTVYTKENSALKEFTDKEMAALELEEKEEILNNTTSTVYEKLSDQNGILKRNEMKTLSASAGSLNEKEELSLLSEEQIHNNSISLRYLELKFNTLVNSLSQKEEAQKILHKQLAEVANETPERTTIKVSVATEVLDKTTVLPIMEQLISKKYFTEMEESCSELLSILKESILTISLFQENLSNFAKEREVSDFNQTCGNCSKKLDENEQVILSSLEHPVALREITNTADNLVFIKNQCLNTVQFSKKTDELLSTLRETMNSFEKEVSQHKIKITTLVKQQTDVATFLTEKEVCLKMAESKLYIAENKLALLTTELNSLINESGVPLEVTPHASLFPDEHIEVQNEASVPNISLKLKLESLIKNNKDLQSENDTYQHLLAIERVRIQELTNLYKEELEDIKENSSLTSKSFTENYQTISPCQVEHQVSEKMMKEIENRKSNDLNDFDSETINKNYSPTKQNTCSETELEALRKENSALMKTCKELSINLQDTIKKCETSLEQVRCANVKLKSELQGKTQEIHSLRRAIVNEINSLNPKLKPTLKEECLQKLLHALLSAVIEKEKELHDKMENHINCLNSEITEKERQHVESEKRKDSWIIQLESEVEQLTKQLESLDSKKLQMIQENSDVSKINKEKEELVKKCSHLEQVIKAFQLQMDTEAETEKLRHRNLISKINSLESNIQYKEKIIMKLEDEIEAKIFKENQLLVKFDNEIKKSNTLECNLNTLEKKLNELEQTKLSLLEEIEYKCTQEREHRDMLILEYEKNQVLASQLAQVETHLENTAQKNGILIEQKTTLEQNLEEEQKKNNELLSKVNMMEQETGNLKWEAISMKNEFEQEKAEMFKRIQEMEYDVEKYKTESIENLKFKDIMIKQLELEVEKKLKSFESETKKVNELQFNLKVLEEKLRDIESKRSALSREVKCQHEMEQQLQDKLNMEMQKAEVLTKNLAQATAQNKNIIQRNKELINRNMKLELQYDLLQKKKMQVQSILDIVEQEFKSLMEELNAKKSTLIKIYTVGKPIKQNEVMQQGNLKAVDELSCEHEEFIITFRKDINEIKEYIFDFDIYWEELESVKSDNNILYEEREACKAALETEKCKTAQLENEISKKSLANGNQELAHHLEEIGSTGKLTINEDNKQIAARLERTVHQLCKAEKERDYFKQCLKREQEEQSLLTHELQQHKTKLELCTSKNNALHTHARELEMHLEELEDRNNHLELESSKAAHHIAQMQEQIKELTEALAATGKCQCKDLNEEVLKLRDEIAEKTKLEQKCEAESKQVQKLEKDLKVYKDKISSLKAELHRMRHKEQKQNVMHESRSRKKLIDAGVQINEMELWESMSEVAYGMGVVREHILHQMKRKMKDLEGRNEKYKELCRYRMNKIRVLEQKVQHLEDSISQTSSESQRVNKNVENKENREENFINRSLSENVLGAYSLHSTPQKK